MTALAEADVEDAALEWLTALGWQAAHGPDIGPGGTSEERPDYGAVVLERRLRDALARLNAELPPEALDDAFRKLTRPEGSTLEARNRAFHRTLVEGVTVEYRTAAGSIRGAQAAVIDYEDPAANDLIAVNQVTVSERDHTRWPDIVLLVNGLPLGVIELKNPTDEEADIWTAWQQLQTYKTELPSLFATNELSMNQVSIKPGAVHLTAGGLLVAPVRAPEEMRMQGLSEARLVPAPTDHLADPGPEQAARTAQPQSRERRIRPPGWRRRWRSPRRDLTLNLCSPRCSTAPPATTRAPPSSGDRHPSSGGHRHVMSPQQQAETELKRELTGFEDRLVEQLELTRIAAGVRARHLGSMVRRSERGTARRFLAEPMTPVDLILEARTAGTRRARHLAIQDYLELLGEDLGTAAVARCRAAY